MTRPADKLFDKNSAGGKIRDARKRRQEALDEITGKTKPKKNGKK